jgi:hypothetical protein
MPRQPSVPSYRLHKQSGQAIVTLTDPVTRKRRDLPLGRHGTPESRAEYARVLAEWEAAGQRPPPQEAAAAGVGPSVAELLLAYWKHAEGHYRNPDGGPSAELKILKYTLKPLRELYI